MTRSKQKRKRNQEMGRLDRIKQAQEASRANAFNPKDLNAGNVQTIFDRCGAEKDSSARLSCDLFPLILGNDNNIPILENGQKAYSCFDFDRQTILADKANIMYLFGQLHSVHAQKDILTIEDFFEDYRGNRWTSTMAAILELLYLGNCDEIELILPFNARKGNTTRFMRAIQPTLSPKDPDFPAWWAQHRAEWE